MRGSFAMRGSRVSMLKAIRDWTESLFLTHYYIIAVYIYNHVDQIVICLCRRGRRQNIDLVNAPAYVACIKLYIVRT